MTTTWIESSVLEAAHALAQVVLDYDSLPLAARGPGSPAWEHLMWAVGDYARRYQDLVGDPMPDVTRYNGLQLDDGSIVLQGERGVILSELVARAINLDETDILVVEIPGLIKPEAKADIAKQMKALLGDAHENCPILILANGARWHQLTVRQVENALRTGGDGVGADEENELAKTAPDIP